MLQIIIYLGCVYLVVKGLQVVVTAMASSRTDRGGMFALAAITLAICIAAALLFGWAATEQMAAVPSAP